MTKRYKRCKIQNMVRKLIFAIIPAALALAASSCSSTKAEVQQPEKIAAEKIEKSTAPDDEFGRSTQGVKITREEFNADKNEILQIIKELSAIMTSYDFNSWMSYIDPDSLKYWSNPRNLLNASKRLPSKIRLSNLNDYFRYVFVPSRQGRSVEEIRYISRDSVKAVQPRNDRDIVYYNFVRIDGKWMVNIPELQN